jgi:hypothetical protein
MNIRVAVAIGLVDRNVIGNFMCKQGLKELTELASAQALPHQVHQSRCFHQICAAHALRGGAEEAGPHYRGASFLPTIFKDHVSTVPWCSRHLHTSNAASKGWFSWLMGVGKPQGTSSAGGDNVSTPALVTPSLFLGCCM